MKPKLTFANAVALLALFISLGGTVYAAAKINGKTIKVGSIPANRLQPDSVSGDQVNEATLAPVPRAQRAEKAAKALTADEAQGAVRADLAGSAPSATEATRAGRAADAVHAFEADSALVAGDARKLDGLLPSSFLQNGCAEQTIKAAVLIEPIEGTTNTEQLKRFNCLVSGLAVTVPRDGEYILTFDQAPAGFAVAASMSSGTRAAVQPMADGRTFKVTVFGTVIEGLTAARFLLAIF